MSELDNILRESIPLQESGGPAGIMSALAKIENDLARQQLPHAELTGRVKRLEKFMETFTATLAEMSDEDTVTARKEAAKAVLHETPEYQDYLVAVGELKQLDTHYDYLDIRRSIGQSILKATEHDHAKFGKGR